MNLKRFNALLFSFILLITLAGCNNINADISSDLEENSTEASETDNNDISVSDDTPILGDAEESILDTAIREAIFAENIGKYLPGECQGIGYSFCICFDRVYRIWLPRWDISGFPINLFS